MKQLNECLMRQNEAERVLLNAMNVPISIISIFYLAYLVSCFISELIEQNSRRFKRRSGRRELN
jgi:hypothetical protein